jgi:hypothetical protein
MSLSRELKLIAYNMGQGGSRDTALWARLLPELAPDLLFVQESRDPAGSWLAALPAGGSLHWSLVAGRRWGSGLWLREGTLKPLAVPEPFAGWVAAAVVEGPAWPGSGVAPVLALSVHAPKLPSTSYIKGVGRILDLAADLAAGRPLIMGGDFNVAVGLRQPGHELSITRGERLLLERMRDEFALIPCWQTAHPNEPLARTLRWLRHSDSPPYHCDGLFIPTAWAGALTSCTVLERSDWDALSDHNPVIAILLT